MDWQWGAKEDCVTKVGGEERLIRVYINNKGGRRRGLWLKEDWGKYKRMAGKIFLIWVFLVHSVK